MAASPFVMFLDSHFEFLTVNLAAGMVAGGEQHRQFADSILARFASELHAGGAIDVPTCTTLIGKVNLGPMPQSHKFQMVHLLNEKVMTSRPVPMNEEKTQEFLNFENYIIKHL